LHVIVTRNISMRFPFDNSYAKLPKRFFAELGPTPVAQPSLIKINHPLARQLGLDPLSLDSSTGTDVFAGNYIPDGSKPIAQAYAGHQFGHWVPQLGDGRAILLGEVVDGNGLRHDIQLKGAGRTPFSRNGDGRAWIGPVLREYVVSEAMAALGIPTTRALAAVTTGETVAREQLLPGAVLTRVAKSHVRVGTFQFFAARQDLEAVRLLAEHAIDRHYPEARQQKNPYLGLLEGVVARQASLIAGWMGVGFIHGVMNTDNTSIAGETIDYGPCAFMDTYHPETVFSSIDQFGRYAYLRQPEIAQWNLSCLASAILPLIHPNEDAAVEMATGTVGSFSGHFETAWSTVFRAKIGLGEEQDGDSALALDLLNRMSANRADFSLTFRRLCGLPERPAQERALVDAPVRELFADAASFDGWAEKWRARLARDERCDHDRRVAMQTVNPAYIPRNHRVEQMISAAVDGDLSQFETLIEILSRPYDDQLQNSHYQMPPHAEEIVHETFCGT
jgi:serine/tyrosine/threonine adenylyltransferase